MLHGKSNSPIAKRRTAHARGFRIDLQFSGGAGILSSRLDKMFRHRNMKPVSHFQAVPVSCSGSGSSAPTVRARAGSSFRQDPRRDSTESRAPASLRDRCGLSDRLPVKCAGARCHVSLRFSVRSASVPDPQHEQAHRAPVRSSSRSQHRLPVCSM